MMHTMAELASQEADLLPERETLSAFGRPVDIDVIDVTRIAASNSTTALFGGTAVGIQSINVR
jgi:hypothetical protein